SCLAKFGRRVLHRDQFKKFILVQPERIGILLNELIYRYAIQGWWPLYSDLLAVYKDPLVLILSLGLCSFPRTFLSWRKCFLNLCHTRHLTLVPTPAARKKLERSRNFVTATALVTCFT